MVKEITEHKPSTNWLALLISISSVIGIVLALLGYGVAIAVQSRFGLPHSMTFSSTLELFNLGCWAVAQILIDSVDSTAVWKTIREIWATAWPVTSVIIGVAMCGALVFWLLVFITTKSRPWILSAFSKSTSGQSFGEFLSSHPLVAKTLAILTVMVGVTIGTPILMGLSLIALAVLCAFLALIPSVGHTVGKTYIDQWVVRPTVCLAISSRDKRMEQAARPPRREKPIIFGASCIAVFRAREEVDRGRVIFATPSAVLLFDPRTGDVRRVSIDGATIKVIGEL